MTDMEKEQLTYLSRHVENVVVVVNTGGQIDLTFLELGLLETEKVSVQLPECIQEALIDTGTKAVDVP